MYDDLAKRLRYCRNNAAVITDDELMAIADQAADAIEILQTLSDEQSRIIAEMGAKYQEAVNAVGELEKDKDFLNFLWNTIQPNEMEAYLSMYNAGSEKEES